MSTNWKMILSELVSGMIVSHVLQRSTESYLKTATPSPFKGMLECGWHLGDFFGLFLVFVVLFVWGFMVLCSSREIEKWGTLKP